MRRTLRAAALAALCLAACMPTPTETVTPSPSVSVAPETSPSPLAPSPTPTQRPVLASAAADELMTLLAGLPGEAGVAIARAGSPAVVLGTLTTGAAWSTAKVPVAIASHHIKGTQLKRWRERAITVSDNDAANELWRALGKPEVAAYRSTAVLRAGGDQTTVINSRKTLSEYSAFGQTQWKISDAATFASQLPCIPEASEVYELMGRIVIEQSWGLGRIEGTHFKGGWGPLGSRYLVRQLGVVTLGDGSQVGVAIITTAPDLQRGSESLTRIADWLKAHRADLGGGSCQTP